MKGGNLSVCVSERAGRETEGMRKEGGGGRWREEECVSGEPQNTTTVQAGTGLVVGRPVRTLPAYWLVF